MLTGMVLVAVSSAGLPVVSQELRTACPLHLYCHCWICSAVGLASLPVRLNTSLYGGSLKEFPCRPALSPVSSLIEMRLIHRLEVGLIPRRVLFLPQPSAPQALWITLLGLEEEESLLKNEQTDMAVICTVH